MQLDIGRSGFRLVLGMTFVMAAQVALYTFAGASSRRPTPEHSSPPNLDSAALESTPALRTGPAYDTDAALPERAVPIASYEWRVKLDSNEHRLSASGTIRWSNPARTPATELYFHLYLNAFKNSETLFLRSPFGAGRSGDRAQQFGYIDVKKLVARELDNQDLWPRAASHTPGDPKDQTDIMVPLPQPIQPGSELTLDVEFEVQLPEIVERTGYQGSYHFVAQWFPKLAKLEKDGTWVHFPFHAQSEFYADFGDYKVTLDVPQGFVLGASGTRTGLKEANGRTIATYEQRNVIDFAWVAWDGFLTHRAEVEGVTLRLLYPQGYDAAKNKTLEAIRGALPQFNERFGRYPYQSLTVVHPPEAAMNSGGMEYPTLITTGGRWFTPYLTIRDTEIVTVHELAHQWFYGLIATNEYAWPFLDEGLTSYAESSALLNMYGPGSLMDNALGSLSVLSFARAMAASRGQDDVIAKPARDFTSFGSLGALVYQRTATVLDTFARVYGRAKLEQALGRYARYYRYKHPTPSHLSAVLEETLGRKARQNFDKAMFERGDVDYVARGMQSVRETPSRGVFDAAEGRKRVTAKAASARDLWQSRVVVVRQGELSFPVDVEMTFEDKTRVVKHWNGEGKVHTVQHRGPSRLMKVHIDPEHKVRLDSNLLNNALREQQSALPVSRELVLFAAELALTLFGP